MTLTRHINRAAVRTKGFNFSLVGLTGFDLHGKTAGIVGTGKIGRIFADICRGFGMRVLAHDAHPKTSEWIEYVTLDRLLAESDVVSLHCPLLPDTKHLINAETLAKAKRGFTLINTSRGGLVDSEALLSALRDGTVGAAGGAKKSDCPHRTNGRCHIVTGSTAERRRGVSETNPDKHGRAFLVSVPLCLCVKIYKQKGG